MNCYSQQIIIPLKPFRQDILDNYYVNLELPLMRELYFDFFDVMHHYVASYSLNSTIAVENVTLGFYKYNTYDKMIFPITLRTIFDYP